MTLDYVEPIQPLHRSKYPEVGVVRTIRLFLSEEVPLDRLGHLV